MFFTVSKVFWLFASPVLLLIIVAFVGVILARTRFGLIAQAAAVVATGLLFLAATPPFAGALVSPLENRFPEPPADMPAPYGILILGGALSGDIGADRGQAVFNEGERLVQGALLAKRFPQARVVFSGGSGSLFAGEDSVEAEEARKLLVALGVDPARITLEDRSRNTDENARFSAALLHPTLDQEWLLVTSGFHIPRSMGLFRKAGFNVVAWPVAFRTYGPGIAGVDSDPTPGRNIRIAEIALREWIGLLTYRAAGKIDHLFPGPADAKQ